jgi:DNA polymerase
MDCDFNTLLQYLQFYSSLGVSLTSGDSVPSLDDDISLSTVLQSLKGRSLSKVECVLPASVVAISVSLKPVASSSGKALNTLEEEVHKDVKDIKSLCELREFVENFDRCDLKNSAINTVFCDGNSDAKIVIIGEAPGEQEDKQGIPFCGKSGMLLDKALLTVGLERSKNVYVTNSLFWRPPANRKPTNEEIAMCRPIVEKHIALMSPKILLLFGATAMDTMLRKSGITKYMGSFNTYTNRYIDGDIVAVPLFHPAFLLRNPSSRKDVWFALLKVRQWCEEQGIL